MLFYVLLLMLQATPTAEDWLRFRGPNGAGISKTSGVPPSSGPPGIDCGRRPFPSAARHRSSRVIGSSSPREGEKLITLCLDRVTGKTLWRSETILAVNDLAEEVWATPAIGHRTIYIRTRTAVYAFGVTF